MNIKKARELYKSARESYYATGSSSLSDAEYDDLEDLLRREDPDNPLLKKTGAPVGKKSEVKLFVPMPSLSKIKIENSKALTRFLSFLYGLGHGVNVSSKVDGSSVEVLYKSGRLTRVSTRGDGVTGKNISHFIPYVSGSRRKGHGLPSRIDYSGDLVLRMEATIEKDLHQNLYSEEYASDRAMASAVFNRHTASGALKDLDFVLLSVSSPSMNAKETDTFAEKHGFIRPLRKLFVKNAPTRESLTDALADFVSKSPYSLDGLVVGPRTSVEEASEDLPKMTRSVKVDDHTNARTSIIEEIVWQPSAHGILVPKAVISPVKFGNVVVRQAALHNVQWAQSMGTGVGAVVKVIRSGEIIPKIVRVLKASKFEMPDPLVYGAYDFDGTRISLREDSDSVTAKKIHRMCSALGLEDIGLGFASKLTECGFRSTRDAAFISMEDIQSLPGVKSSDRKIFAQMKRISSGEFTIPQLMNASGCFSSGLGTTLLNKLSQDHPELLSSASAMKGLTRELVSESIGPARADILMSGLEDFRNWVKGMKVKPIEGPAPTVEGPLTGSNFSWTGYRSEEEENYVKSLGGRVIPFGPKTTILFFRPGGKPSSKVEKAGSRACEFRAVEKTALRNNVLKPPCS